MNGHVINTLIRVILVDVDHFLVLAHVHFQVPVDFQQRVRTTIDILIVFRHAAARRAALHALLVVNATRMPDMPDMLDRDA